MNRQKGFSVRVSVFRGAACVGVAFALALPLAAGAAAEPVEQVQQLAVAPLQQRAFNGQLAQQRWFGEVANAQLARRPREPFSGPLTAAAVNRAVADALQYFRALQTPEGAIGENSGYATGGFTALAALSMLAAGAHPATDEALQRALNWLAGIEVDNTYVRGIRANVWEYALRKVPNDARIRAALQKDYDWLMAALGDKEGWRYQLTSTDWDNSVTQYGVLGVWAAARAGIDPGDAFWVRMSRHFRAVQNEDGGWGYQAGSSTANMATAGLATMFLVFDKYHGKNFYERENPRAFATGDAAACLASIGRGMQWLAQHGGGYDQGYYLYGIERTGVASGRRHIGGADWFAKGAREVLGRQQADGSIPLGGHGGTLGNTAFSTLFLVYGGAPAAFAKLQYGKEQDWNLNPRDLANVTAWLWSAYERPLNWFSVDIGAPVEEFEAPILLVTGTQAPAFAAAELDKLRAYIERGGTLLLEPSDHSPAFAAGAAALLERLYPAAQYPACRLAPLPADHGIFSAMKQGWQALPRLRGASDGARTFFLVSDEYLSADWQMNRTEADAFKLALNLLFYATDMRELEGRFAGVAPAARPAEGGPSAPRTTVARWRYTGSDAGPLDWAAGRGCWQRVAPHLQGACGLELEEREPVSLADGCAPEVGICISPAAGASRSTRGSGRRCGPSSRAAAPCSRMPMRAAGRSPRPRGGSSRGCSAPWRPPRPMPRSWRGGSRAAPTSRGTRATPWRRGGCCAGRARSRVRTGSR